LRTTILSPVAMPAVISTFSPSKASKRTGLGTNSSGSRCANTMVWPFGACASAAQHDACDALTRVRDHRDRRAGIERHLGLDNLELQDRILLLQDTAAAKEPQLDAGIGPDRCGGFVDSVWVELIEYQRLDQQARRVNDLKQLIVRRDDLAGDDPCGGDHAIDRRA
jgi:hypothetical protein